MGGQRSLLVAAAAVIAATAGVLAVPGASLTPHAQAAPSGAPQYLKTIRCDSPNPWPRPVLRINVDLYTGMRYPSDGLPGPAIELRAGQLRAGGPAINLTGYTIGTTVRWANTRTGQSGTVTVPTTTNTVGWQVVVHPGAGPVRMRITQKIGAMAFFPMVNPQTRICRTSAIAR